MKKIYGFLLLLLAITAYVALFSIPQQMRDGDRIPITKGPADVGLAFDNFAVSPADQDLNLAGWWMPASSPRATMVFIHGGGSNRHTDYLKALEFYRTMVDAGVSVAAIDLRNHGESDADGKGVSLGVTEKEDAIAAVQWARQKQPDQPLFLMGISMGGATVIHAAATGLALDGLILLDPLLQTSTSIKRAAWTATGLPPALFTPSAWAAITLHGMPGPGEQSLDVATELQLPILLLQDPGDPVILAEHARALANRNTNVTLWEAPPVADDHPELAWRERWGSHVAAFALYPEQTMREILAFIERESPAPRD